MDVRQQAQPAMETEMVGWSQKRKVRSRYESVGGSYGRSSEDKQMYLKGKEHDSAVTEDEINSGRG